MAIARTQPLAGPVPHPGEVLKDELEARGLSAHALAIALRLPASRDKPDPARPARGYPGNCSPPRPLFRRIDRALAAPADGLRPRPRRSRPRPEIAAEATPAAAE